jgi:O-antigen ligase
LQSSASTGSAAESEREPGSRASRRRLRSFDRERLDQFCERGVLGCVLAMLVFGPMATGSTRASQFLVLLGLGVLLIGFWLVRIWARQQYRFLFPPFAWVVVAFSAYAIWRYSEADIEYAARLELLQILLYAVLFFAVLDNLSRQETIQILLFSLLIIGMLNAFYAVFQYFTESKFVLWFPKPNSYRGRGSGTYICPNHLAGFLEMLLPIALAYTITGRYKSLTKVFLAYAALAMVAGIGVTMSRGGYLATGGALAVFFIVMLWNRDFRIPALGILVLLLAGGSFFGFRSWQTQKRFEEIYHHPERSMRLNYWRPAINMWQENFWFGVGANHYDWRFREWRFWKLQGRPMYVHNDYLNTVAEYGTAGGIIVAAGLVALGWGVFRTWKYVRRTNEIATKPSNRSSVVLGCAIGLLAMAFHSVCDFNMHIPGNAIIGVTLMAILTSHLRFATERYWLNPGVLGRVLGTVLLAAAAAFFAWQLSRLVPQTVMLSKYSPNLGFEEKVALLKKAYPFEPKNYAVTLELGEVLRKKAFEGDEGWEKLAREAVEWFELGVRLNPWSPYNYMNLGMCYQWMNQPEKAGELFDRALKLDPKASYLLAMYGWHKLQLNELEAARRYFKESYTYYPDYNPFAKGGLELVERRLAEQQQNR